MSSASIANTPNPPYYSAIFTSLRTEGKNGYSAVGERMVQLACQQHGLLGIESVRGDDGFGITVSYSNLVEFHTDPAGEQLTRRIVTFRKMGEYFRRHEETHVLKLYRSTDIAKMLRDTGFRVRQVCSYGEYRLPDGLAGLIARAD
jgi:hypothetical protein